ncbi:MAG TPA: hypothetical protein VFG87_06075 [Amycolatopsis sp.]|nr:hypothetical protein [Amycolatopsis sp.]
MSAIDIAGKPGSPPGSSVGVVVEAPVAVSVEEFSGVATSVALVPG